jgi:hypothetical protein
MSVKRRQCDACKRKKGRTGVWKFLGEFDAELPNKIRVVVCGKCFAGARSINRISTRLLFHEIKKEILERLKQKCDNA